ncbi:MAG: exodeoxyribonuclease III [Acetobacteraceae bacterium]|nr:exodeoxyribonuclease III [Acetobacteraceae bacterium]
MKIASWNVNSIRQRESHVLSWLERVQPDVLFLQEIKCTTEQFPALAFTGLGYRVEAHGQKAYNGVAVLSRVPFTTTHRALPGLPEDDDQARYIEIEIDGPQGGITMIGIYLPNGNSGEEAGYTYKLEWMDRLAERAQELLDDNRELIITGDFNVCPEVQDLAPGALGPTDALVRPETRARYRRLLWLGLTDAIRALYPTDPVWTFYDYQAAAFERNSGLRIDHALLSPTVAERLISAMPDKAERAKTRPSDHVPLLVEIDR